MKLAVGNSNAIMIDIYLRDATTLRGCFVQGRMESNGALLNVLATLEAVGHCLADQVLGTDRVLSLSGDERELRVRVDDVTAISYHRLAYLEEGYPIYRTVTLSGIAAIGQGAA